MREVWDLDFTVRFLKCFLVTGNMSDMVIFRVVREARIHTLIIPCDTSGCDYIRHMYWFILAINPIIEDKAFKSFILCFYLLKELIFIYKNVCIYHSY